MTPVPRSSSDVPRIAITLGEPGGIGPDIVLSLAEQKHTAQLVIIGDPELLAQRARQLNKSIKLSVYDSEKPVYPTAKNELNVLAVPLAAAAEPGQLNRANAASVLRALDVACDGCMRGEFSAMVTAPVQKSVINDAGIKFSGHTEYLAKRCGGQLPVMMLANENSKLRVALVTTHLPLRAVPDAINKDKLSRVCRIVAEDMQRYFNLDQPRIAVLGLNPHAGENGNLGSEEQELIQPVINQLIEEGLALTGPLPADTAFTQTQLRDCDAVIAMYHDQGLPVIKHAGFGNVVNITLGLPIIRTSVDHGTALDLAGSGKASAESLQAAVSTAIAMSSNSRKPG